MPARQQVFADRAADAGAAASHHGRHAACSTKASTQAANAQACAFVELVPTEGGTERYGVGLDHNIVTACIQALISGVNRLGLVPTDEPADMAA